MVAILSLKMVVSGALDVLFVLLALEVFDIGESGAGLLNAALGLGVIAGGAATFAVVGRQRLAPVLALAAGASGLGLAVLSAVSPVWAAPLVVTAGIGFAACDVLGRTILQRVTPDRVLARVFGALEGLALASLALGAILAPVVVLAVGVQGALVVAGLLLPAGIASSWLGLRAMDRRARPGAGARPAPGGRDLRAAATAATRMGRPPGAMGHLRTRRGHHRRGRRGRCLLRPRIGDAPGHQARELLRVLSERGAGVGEIALLRDVPRTATVTSETVSVMLMVGRAAFLEAVTGHPQTFETARRVVGAMS